MPDARAPDATVDITTADFTLDPWAGYDSLRQQSAVIWTHSARGFLMTDHAHAAQALRHGALEEADFLGSWRMLSRKLGKSWERSFRLFSYFPFVFEGEHHRKLRAAHARGVAPFADAHDVFARHVKKKIDAVRDLSGFDLVEDFAGSLFLEILLDLMGFDEDRRAPFMVLGSMSWLLDSTLPVRRRDEVEQIFTDCLGLLVEEVARTLEAREGTVLHAIQAALPSDEKANAPVATAHIAAVMLMMGTDAVASCITFPVRRLLSDQDGEARIPQARWADLSDDAIRYAAPVDFLNRIAREDVEIGGCAFHRGERLIVSPLAANHDPSVFGPDPGTVRPRGSGGVGLAFGAGAHVCIGARMSRAIVRSAFEGLAGLPPMLLAGPGRQAPGKVVRTMTSLPILFDLERVP